MARTSNQPFSNTKSTFLMHFKQLRLLNIRSMNYVKWNSIFYSHFNNLQMKTRKLVKIQCTRFDRVKPRRGENSMIFLLFRVSSILNLKLWFKLRPQINHILVASIQRLKWIFKWAIFKHTFRFSSFCLNNANFLC